MVFAAPGTIALELLYPEPIPQAVAVLGPLLIALLLIAVGCTDAVIDSMIECRAHAGNDDEAHQVCFQQVAAGCEGAAARVSARHVQRQ